MGVYDSVTRSAQLTKLTVFTIEHSQLNTMPKNLIVERSSNSDVFLWGGLQYQVEKENCVNVFGQRQLLTFLFVIKSLFLHHKKCAYTKDHLPTTNDCPHSRAKYLEDGKCCPINSLDIRLQG